MDSSRTATPPYHDSRKPSKDGQSIRDSITVATDPEKIPQHPELEPLDGGRAAWLCVFGGFMLSFICYGVLTSFGAFQEYYRVNQLKHRSINDISWIGSIELCLVLLVGCVSGPVFDAGYFRHLIISGGALYVFCLFMTSISTEYYQFVLAQGLGVGLAQGLIFTPAMSCLAHHFKRLKPFVFGIFAAGASVGGTVLPIAVQRLFGTIGFAWTVRLLAFIVLFCVSVGLICCTAPLPPRKDSRVLDFRVFKSIPYTLLVIGSSLAALGIFGPVTYGVTYAVDHNVKRELAFYSLSILNACSFFGRIIPNIIATTLGPLNVLICACLISSIMLFSWVHAQSTTGILVFYAFYGLASGSYVSGLPASAACLAEDPKETGLRLGMMFFVNSFFWLASGPLQGILIRSFGYKACSIFTGCAVLTGVVCMLFSRAIFTKHKGTQKV